ncbi:hypothetical protein SK128_010833, partial [Halocaridina rubra]
YKQEEDGYFRLQTIRYESIELTQEGDDNMQVVDRDEEEEIGDSCDNMSSSSTPASLITPTSAPSSAPIGTALTHNKLVPDI